jgi:hypothetical protein
MGADKVYAWEHRQFKWHYAVKIAYEHRRRVAIELAKKFGIKDLRVDLDTRGGGRAFVMQRRIRLPSWRHPCSLGLILHEIAHVWDWIHLEGNGHRASFKKAMIKLAIETRAMRYLPPIFAQIRLEEAARLAQARKGWDRSRRAQEAAQRAVDRRLALRERKKTPEWRLEHARARIKALGTRIKRLQTAQRKAERQARALERVVARRVSESAGSDTPAAQVAHL